MSFLPQPDIPDYTQLARQQGDANKETGVSNGILNNPNINAPGYTQTTTFDQVPDYAAYVNANPDLYDHFTQGRENGDHDLYRYWGVWAVSL